MDYIFYFGITIAILVFIHELGHFLAAKICKMRVNVFAIGFGKRLLGYNKVNGFSFGNLPENIDLGDSTDYRISMIPLGGYVKIVGMVDESMDTEFAKSEPQPYEFRSKPTIQKLFVISAGVLMNLLLTLMIFWNVNYFVGKQVWDTTTVGSLEDHKIADSLGFKNNDKILEVNGKKVTYWQDALEAFLVNSATAKEINVTFNRNDSTQTITIPSKIISDNQKGFFLPPSHTAVYISNVLKDSPAAVAGIKNDDIFIAVNDIYCEKGSQASQIIAANKSQEISIKVLRDKDTLIVKATPDFNGKLGVHIVDIYNGPTTTIDYGLLTSLKLSFTNITDYTFLTFSMLKNVIGGQVKFDQAFGGPVKIAQFAAKSADNGIVSFLMFLALLSLSLAIINALPLPAIDGGHFIIILIEGIMKREIPLKVKIAIQNVGFFLLLALMAFVIYSDILSVF